MLAVRRRSELHSEAERMIRASGLAGARQDAISRKEDRMRSVALVASVLIGLFAALAGASAQPSCRVCMDQQKACMKNYAGPACKTEYRMCLKACKK